MPAKRATYHHHDLGNALVIAASELIAEKGVAAFSLREAARVVGVDPAACYRHFRDKDALLDEVARRGFTRLAERLEAAGVDGDAATLPALAREYVAFAFAEPATFRVMFGTAGVDARDPRRRGAYERGPYEILEATLAAKLGDRAHASSALMLWTGVHGIAVLGIDGAILGGDRAKVLALTDASIATLLRGLSERVRSPRSARRRTAGSSRDPRR